MNQFVSKFFLVKISILAYLLAPTSTSAQIVPDATLINNSSLNNQGSINTITGGTQTGNNLFHSFKQFSVPTGNTAYFNNAPDIQNIFSRVTGGSVSSIDGLIRANGTANLFLINPNGIIFGSNARLDIGGSFLASTASSIKFADDTQFNAKTPQTASLLKISVPIGLEFASNPGEVRVQGTGHNLSLGFSAIRRSSSTGLRVQPGKTLALLGGDVVLEGGNLVAEGGRIELGSVESSSVSFSPTTEWAFSYGGILNFKNINLSQRALVDVSGVSGGSAQVQGANVTLMNGSVVLSQNQGGQPSGSLKVNASESLELSGTSPTGSIPSILRTETVGSGDGGNINVSAGKLLVQGGAGISSRTYSIGKGGNLTVNTSESIQLLGSSRFNPLITSNVSASTSASGNAGNIKLSTRQLILQDGGTVSSLTRGAGSGGKVIVDATNSIQLTTSVELINSGLDYGPTVLSATAFNLGDAGSLEINTPRFVVGDKTLVNTSTLGSGSAGSVIINAPGSVEVSGAIGSSTVKADETTQKLFGSPPMPSGSSGDVAINTGRLNLVDGGLISVRNQGSGRAGTLKINANSIKLDNQAEITASTESGQGGNIKINSDDWLLMRRNSRISTNAGNAQAGGDGGQINIDTKFLIAPPLENSDITANAFIGKGGNVDITASAIFGFVPRSRAELQTLLRTDNPNELDPSQLPSNDVTAISQTNPSLSGQVTFNILDTGPRQALSDLPEQPVDVSALVTQGCSGSGSNVAEGKSEFMITGRGGLPPQPGDPLRTEAIVANDGILVAPEKNRLSLVTAKVTTPSTSTHLVEAQGWLFNNKGEVVLTSQPSNAKPNSSDSTVVTCYAP